MKSRQNENNGINKKMEKLLKDIEFELSHLNRKDGQKSEIYLVRAQVLINYAELLIKLRYK